MFEIDILIDSKNVVGMDVSYEHSIGGSITLTDSFTNILYLTLKVGKLLSNTT